MSNLGLRIGMLSTVVVFFNTNFNQIHTYDVIYFIFISIKLHYKYCELNLSLCHIL